MRPSLLVVILCASLTAGCSLRAGIDSSLKKGRAANRMQ